MYRSALYPSSVFVDLPDRRTGTELKAKYGMKLNPSNPSARNRARQDIFVMISFRFCSSRILFLLQFIAKRNQIVFVWLTNYSWHQGGRTQCVLRGAFLRGFPGRKPARRFSLRRDGTPGRYSVLHWSAHVDSRPR